MVCFPKEEKTWGLVLRFDGSLVRLGIGLVPRPSWIEAIERRRSFERVGCGGSSERCCFRFSSGPVPCGSRCGSRCGPVRRCALRCGRGAMGRGVSGCVIMNGGAVGCSLAQLLLAPFCFGGCVQRCGFGEFVQGSEFVELRDRAFGNTRRPKASYHC